MLLLQRLQRKPRRFRLTQLTDIQFNWYVTKNILINFDEFGKEIYIFSFQLNELKGGVVFSVVGTTGVTPNIIFTMGCEVDGQQYQGKLILKIVLEFHEIFL